MDVELIRTVYARLCTDLEIKPPEVVIVHGNVSANTRRGPVGKVYGKFNAGDWMTTVSVGDWTHTRTIRSLVAELNRIVLHETRHAYQATHKKQEWRKVNRDYWADPLEVDARAFEDDNLHKYKLFRVGGRRPARTRMSRLATVEARVRSGM